MLGYECAGSKDNAQFCRRHHHIDRRTVDKYSQQSSVIILVILDKKCKLTKRVTLVAQILKSFEQYTLKARFKCQHINYTLPAGVTAAVWFKPTASVRHSQISIMAVSTTTTEHRQRCQTPVSIIRDMQQSQQHDVTALPCRLQCSSRMTSLLPCSLQSSSSSCHSSSSSSSSSSQ